ncbi:HNH endonuclease [Vibrio parahaemolyticus]|uniref:HNH endonuclease n=1 Tax=Vibrio parahaemolyticus TaxID=670 RepID=UPI0011223040|nr:HNH endonuclease signature motif containing protein [Vibrio parahaemolyticus]TOK06028.1 HNH endonuclease [Vibrio parahaemolyticus]
MDKARLKGALFELINDESIEVQNGLRMLKHHYHSEEQFITASSLAKAAGYDSYEIANKQYGSFARKLSEKSGFIPTVVRDGIPVWTFVLCDETSHNGSSGYVWKLRSEISELLEELGVVKRSFSSGNILEDIRNAESRLSREKYKESVIQARVGQGQFRTNQVNYWNGCAVTGCSEISLLIASHIKPWSVCSTSEALSVTNGLLLTPNIDKAFDKGYISFNCSGHIMITEGLNCEERMILGINENMKIREDKYTEEHKDFMRFHNVHVFRDDC